MTEARTIPDLPGRIAAVIATRRAACDATEARLRDLANLLPHYDPAVYLEQVAERRAYLTGFENIAAMHAERASSDRCGRCVATHWPCPHLGYVAAALGIDP